MDESPTLIEALVAAVAMFIGSTVLSTVGFGIGMTAIPILLFVLDPQTVIVVLNAVSIPLFALIVYQNRTELPKRRVLPWAIAGIVGVPVGVIILRDADATILKIAITVVIIALTILVASNVKTPIPKGMISGLAIAFIVAVMLNALGIGGPLIALYALAQGWGRNTVRGALSLYFLCVEAAGVVGYGFAGLITMERVWLIAIVIVPVVLGFWLGTQLVRRMNEAMFQRAAVAVILVTSAMVLVREVSAL